MKSIQQCLLATLVIGAIIFTSCKKDDDPVSCNYAVELQEELNTLTNAANVYAANPTTENCNAYKDAFNDYLDEAENYVDCATVAGQGAQLQADIDAARASLDALQC